MNESTKRVILVTADQVGRLAKGETVEIVPARAEHQILIDVDDESDLITAEYIPSESETKK